LPGVEQRATLREVRTDAMSRPSATSATLSAFAPGLCVTAIPRAAAASRSTDS
jgi:hypothetical protein